MLATSLTAAVVGVDAHLVRVEADTASGFPKFTLVGLADSSVRESEGRIRAALRNCGYEFKWDRRITVNLAPADLAAALCVSLRTLERGLASALDCTPSQLILAMKMREARRMLRSGRYRVGEVADRLGFPSQFHFSRRFKAYYRVPPSELRDHERGQH